MANQERNSEMVSLLSVDFINKADTAYVAGIALSSLLMLPGLVAVWPMQLSLGDSSDLFADYAYLPGRTGGQTLNGGVNAGEDLTLHSTAHATKGNIFVGNSTYDEVNNRLGIGTVSPAYPLDVVGRARSQGSGGFTAGMWLSDSTPTDRAFIGLNEDDATPIVGIFMGSWRLLVDSSGNVGIGITPGTYTLNVNGSLQCTQAGETWIGASFTSGWGNFHASYASTRYKRVGDLVFVEGMAQRTSGSSAVIFTLPAGYRPSKIMIYPQVSNDLIARVDIAPDGTVTLAVGTATVWVTLNGIVFSTL